MPDYFDVSEMKCLNKVRQVSDRQKIILPMIFPLFIVVLLTLGYKFKKSEVWNHSYGTLGHVNAMVNVRNYALYRCLLVLILALAVNAIAFAVGTGSAWDNPDFVIIFVVSSVNILNSYSSLRSHTDATLEVGKIADTIRIGKFRLHSKVETVMEAMEDGIMVMLTTGHDTMLTHELKVSAADCLTLKECVMGGGVVERHSVRAYLESWGRSSTPKKIEGGGSEPAGGEWVKFEKEGGSWAKKLVSFMCAQSTFIIATLNCFALVWEVAMDWLENDFVATFPQYIWDGSAYAANGNELLFTNGTRDEAGLAEIVFKIEMPTLTMDKCRRTAFAWDQFISKPFGGLCHNEGAGIIIFLILSLSILLAIFFIAYISEVHKLEYGTFGFVQSISDAPKDRKYRRTIKFVIVLSLCCAIYALFFDNNTCALWNTSEYCEPFDWQKGQVIMMGWCNTAHIIFTTMQGSKTKLAHSPLASGIKIPKMHVWENPKVIYELIQDGLMMYIAKKDLTILQGRLGMSRVDVDSLVGAISSMEVHHDFYSGRLKVSHPETTRKGASKKDLEAKGKFQKVQKVEPTLKPVVGGREDDNQL